MNPSGLLKALFDFSFNEFVTTRIISILYGIMLVIIGLCFLFMFFGGFVSMFTDSFFGGLVMVVLSPIIALFYLILARVWTEIIIVLFRIAENTSVMAKQQTDLAQSTGAAPPPPRPPA